MNAAAELLAELRSLQVEARLNPEGRLALRPASRVPAALLAELKAHRDEVVELLARGPAPPTPWQADPSALSWSSQVGEDPRPDLPGSELWTRLLQLAPGDADDPHGVYGRLLGARACGAVLQLAAGRWKLAPTIDPGERLSTWHDRESWEVDFDRWLKPKWPVSRLPAVYGPPDAHSVRLPCCDAAMPLCRAVATRRSRVAMPLCRAVVPWRRDDAAGL
jgi:hypothetical protein